MFFVPIIQQDCLTLSNVKHLLDIGLEQHGQNCDCEPVYTVMSETGISNLLMTCPVSAGKHFALIFTYFLRHMYKHYLIT